MISTTTPITIIGTGGVGAALGRRLAGAGFPVCFGVRGNKDVSALLAACGDGASAAAPAEAAAAGDIVFLAVPAKAALDATRSLGDLAGKILVDCNNPLSWSDGPVWDPPPEGSLAAAIAAAAPSARVVKAFNTFGAEFHADPAVGEHRIDVPMAADDADAKATVASVAKAAGFVPVDAGPLRNAAVIENVAILWIHLAMVGGQGRNFAFKMLRR